MLAKDCWLNCEIYHNREIMENQKIKNYDN